MNRFFPYKIHRDSKILEYSRVLIQLKFGKLVEKFLIFIQSNHQKMLYRIFQDLFFWFLVSFKKIPDWQHSEGKLYRI
jgi:hypothetical protein